MKNNDLNLPPDEVPPGADHLGPAPYVVVAVRPFHSNNTGPFPGRKCSLAQRLFNYTLSRARRIVENTFGLLAVRWRIFYSSDVVGVTTLADVFHFQVTLSAVMKTNIFIVFLFVSTLSPGIGWTCDMLIVSKFVYPIISHSQTNPPNEKKSFVL
jgi:hypothetical protein